MTKRTLAKDPLSSRAAGAATCGMRMLPDGSRRIA